MNETCMIPLQSDTTIVSCFSVPGVKRENIYGNGPKQRQQRAFSPRNNPQKKALSSKVQDDGRGGRGYYYFIGAASCKVTGQGTEDRLTANWVLQPYIGIVH